MMNYFRGQIEGLENILIDNFLLYKTSTCFFLSHCHSDHMVGVSNLLSSINKSNFHVYCSPISRLILLNKYNFVCENIIQELTSSKVISVPGNDRAPTYQVTVTPIPAGHCPGSIMFLFESINQAILYTGDFRISRGDISSFKAFHSKNQIKLIDKIYFDSTFLNEIYWDFPLRSEVTCELVRIIKGWISRSLNHNVLLITSALIGYESAFIEVAQKLKCKIHVKDILHDIYTNVPDIGNYLTKDCSITKIHAAGTCDKKCLDLDNENLLKVKLSAQWFQSPKGCNEQPFWKEISKQSIVMCYSTHCSCSELVDFLSYIKPKSIHPLTTAVGSTMENTQEFTKRLIHSWRIQGNVKKDLERKKTDLSLAKNYAFELKLPE